MIIEDDTPYEPGFPLSKTQALGLADVVAQTSVVRTKRDNEFREYVTDLANMMHPEPREILLKQIHEWVVAINSILAQQSAEVHRILNAPDQGDEPMGTLQ